MSAGSGVGTTDAQVHDLPPPRINPFVGPRSMGPEDHIHGRDTEIARIRVESLFGNTPQTEGSR